MGYDAAIGPVGCHRQNKRVSVPQWKSIEEQRQRVVTGNCNDTVQLQRNATCKISTVPKIICIMLDVN